MNDIPARALLLVITVLSGEWVTEINPFCAPLHDTHSEKTDNVRRVHTHKTVTGKPALKHIHDAEKAGFFSPGVRNWHNTPVA